MGVFAFVVKRARAGLGLLLTILVLAAGTTAIIAGTLGYSEAAATTAARHALADAAPTEAGIRVQTRLADDPAAQTDTATDIITQAFAPTEVLIQRTIVSEPRGVTDQSGRLVVMAGSALSSDDPDFADRIEVVEGAWPTDGAEPLQGALHASTASTWGVGVGDEIDVSGTPVQVTALWRPVDPQDAFWFGDPLAEAGVDGGNVGPLVVPESAVSSFGSTPFVRFTVQPDPDEIRPNDMPRLAAVAGALDSDLRSTDVDVRGVTVEGDLAPTAAAASRNLATARALNLVPVTLLLLVSLIAIVQIARLQAEARASEVELLIARGASHGQVLAWSLIESVAVAVLAAALGTAAALGVMQLVPAGALQTDLVVRTGLLAGLAVLVSLVAVAVLQVRALARQTATDRSGRTRTVAALGTLVLTLGAAGLSWWQLNRYGSPLVTNPDGSLRTDLVAGAAPALLLAAAALLATTVLGPIGRFVETLSRRSRGLLTHLVSAQISRRIVVYAVPVVLTVLAVGATTVSGLYAGTSASLRDGLAALARGADVRAVVDPAPVSQTSLPTTPTLDGVAGVESSTPVWLTDGRLGSTVVAYTALPVDSLQEAVTVPDGVLDVPSVQEALATKTTPQTHLELPADATSVELSLQITANVKDPQALQDELDQTYEWFGDQFIQEYEDATGQPPTDEQLAGEMHAQAEFTLGGLLSPQQLKTTLWFWDEPSSTLLKVEAPETEMTFGASLSEDARPQVSTETAHTQNTVQVPVEPGPGRTLVGVDLGLPGVGHLYDVEVAIDGVMAHSGPVEGDGARTNLLADPAVDSWVTTLPAQVEPLETPGGSTYTPTSGTVTATDGELVLTAVTGQEASSSREAGTALAGLRDPGLTQIATLDPSTGQLPAPEDALPVALTQSVADTGGFEVGSSLNIQAFGANIPARVAAIATAVPGTTAPYGVLIDSGSLSTFLGLSSTTLGSPTELWAASSDPGATVDAVRDLPGIASASGVDAVSVTDAASAVRLVFWVASAGAVLLAVTGIGAVATNLLRVRRPEVLVLRALGLTPGGQARARTTELFAVVLASIGLGLLAGWLVGGLVVPELARSTTLAGQAQLPAPLALEVPLWAGLLGGLIIALLVLLAVLYATVRRQAVDREYREEIR